MKIALLGFGKMGKRVEELATKKGHIVVCKSNSSDETKLLDLSIADVAIDFSTPSAAFENISHAIKSGIPVISGTTGWLEKIKEIESLCKSRKGAFLYSSNFSLGVNLFFKLNKQLAKIMQDFNYESKIHETHHVEKIDSPSGTALTLKKDLDIINTKEIAITSQRINNITGIHKINYSSFYDEIEIIHKAKNRDGFASGAIIAAEWIIKKKGIYSINDVLA
jgi:4-hydroxy-tetrahydrodipicolinate reductase